MPKAFRCRALRYKHRLRTLLAQNHVRRGQLTVSGRNIPTEIHLRDVGEGRRVPSMIRTMKGQKYSIHFIQGTVLWQGLSLENVQPGAPDSLL